jgi:deoxyribodipyrimidine photolyase
LQVGLYVFDQASRQLRPPAARPPRGAARWWLVQSLRALQASLTSRGAELVLRRGPAAQITAAMARETDAAGVFWNEIAIAPRQAVAEAVAAAPSESGIACRRFASDLLVDPTAMRSKEGRGPRVFTPFWRRAGSRRAAKTAAAPKSLVPVEGAACERLDDWPTGRWVAGSGGDAAPQFPVFNPVLQGEKFDPDGGYVRRWVPELAQLPSPLLHQPWTAAPLELAAAGVTLGKTYPKPIVNHKAGREWALTAYAGLRNG